MDSILTSKNKIKIMIFIFLFATILSITAGAKVGDILIDGESREMRTGDIWVLREGYELKIYDARWNQFLLSKNGESLELTKDPESPKYFYYSNGIEIISIPYTMYLGGDLIKIRLYQRSNGSSDASSKTNQTTTNSKSVQSHAPNQKSGHNGDWPMFMHDNSHSGTAEEVVEPPLELLWKYKTDNKVVSSPAISSGIVYIASDNGYVYALDASTGSLIWKYKIYESVDSSPTVSGGIVYVGSYALDASTANPIWKYESDSSAVADGIAYMGSWGLFSALHAYTGSLIWKREINGPTFMPAAVSNGSVYIGSDDGNVRAFDASTGSLKWNYQTGDNIRSSPAVSGNIVYIGSDTGYLYALEAETGSLVTGNLIWKYKTEESIRSSPAVSGGNIYVGSDDGYVYALTASGGSLKWKYKTGGAIRSSPAVSGNVVYVGSNDYYVYALDAITGNLRWKNKTGGAISSSPAVSGGMVYIGSDDGYLYAFAPATQTQTSTELVKPVMEKQIEQLFGSNTSPTPTKTNTQTQASRQQDSVPNSEDFALKIENNYIYAGIILFLILGVIVLFRSGRNEQIVEPSTIQTQSIPSARSTRSTSYGYESMPSNRSGYPERHTTATLSPSTTSLETASTSKVKLKKHVREQMCYACRRKQNITFECPSCKKYYCEDCASDFHAKCMDCNAGLDRIITSSQPIRSTGRHNCYVCKNGFDSGFKCPKCGKYYCQNCSAEAEENCLNCSSILEQLI